MKKYKGYYIDGVVFKTEAEIDAYHKNSIIEKIRIFNEMLTNPRYNDAELIAITAEITLREKRLHDEYGMSWEDIEEIPFTA